LDLETVRTCNESYRVGFIDRLSLGVDVDDDAIGFVLAVGIFEVVGAAAGLRGKWPIEKATAGVAGLITATVTPTTAAISVATTLITVATTAITVATAAPAATTSIGRCRGRSGGGGLCGADVT
jgi:hypothetical protein